MEKTGRRFEAGTCTGTRDGMSYSHTRDSVMLLQNSLYKKNMQLQKARFALH